MEKSNSNLVITNYSVDPVTQQITNLEVNGSAISTSADLDDNKAATINVSTYTQPVEVTPTSGKDGMKKATITLSNIPVLGNNIYFSYLEKEDETRGYVVTDAANFTNATFFYFSTGGDETEPGDPMQTLMAKITPTNIAADSFTYDGGTWTVRAY